jgi:four helix bundle protein
LLIEVSLVEAKRSLKLAKSRSQTCICNYNPARFYIPGQELSMKYRRFEELPVWKDAIKLAVRTFALTATSCFRGHSGTRNQLENAVVSISNNIAEGFERGTTQELLTFIYISRGSAGETRSMYCLLEKLPEFRNLRSEISDLKSCAESISRQLRAWAESLQNTEIRGTRYLTDKSRRVDKQRREREEFIQELERMQAQNIAQSQQSGRKN